MSHAHVSPSDALQVSTQAPENEKVASLAVFTQVQRTPVDQLLHIHAHPQLLLLAVAFVVGHWLSRRRVAWLSEAGFALLLGVAVGCGVKFFSNSTKFAHWISFKVRHMVVWSLDTGRHHPTHRKTFSSSRCCHPLSLTLAFPSKSSRALRSTLQCINLHHVPQVFPKHWRHFGVRFHWNHCLHICHWTHHVRIGKHLLLLLLSV